MSNKPTSPATTPEVKPVEKAYIKAVRGDMLHLFTGVLFTQDPKKVEIDGFVRVQLDAGKLQIVAD